MISPLEIGAGLFFILIATLTMQRCFGLTRILVEPSLPSMLFLCHLFMHVIPSVIFLFDETMISADRYFWGNVVAAVLIPPGCLFAQLLYPGVLQPARDFFATETEYGRRYRIGSKFAVWTLGAVAAFIAFLYIRRFPQSAFLSMVRSLADFSEVLEMRQEMAEAGFIFGFNLIFILPFLFVLVAAEWKFQRGFLFRAIGLGLMFLALYYNSYSTRKTPVAMLFVLVMLLFLLRSSRRNEERLEHLNKMRLRKYTMLALLAAIIIGYPVFVYKKKAWGSELSLGEIVTSGVFERIFIKPAENTYLAFESFPETFPYTRFRDVSKIAKLTGDPYINISSMISEYKGQSVDSMAPPTTVGRFWAQAGWWAITFGTFIEAFIVGWINIFLTRTGKVRSPFLEAVYVVCLWGCFRLSMGYFYGVFLSECFVPALAAFVAYLALTRLISTGAQAKALPAGGNLQTIK